MTDYIDPEELPFTTDEIYRAACRFLPPETARVMADHLTTCGPDAIETREERRARWRGAGVANADTALFNYWVYPEELLAALSELSGDVAARVELLRRRLKTLNSNAAVL